MSERTYEVPGGFYIGRRYDEAQGVTNDAIVYDAKDLTTHAVCVGMTGSGKTGLCVTLLEEAAIDGIPALVIDPKGDLGSLLLTFPELSAEAFEPWIDPAEAVRAGQEPAAYAAKVAKRWRDGLASWDQDGARIQRLRDAADVAIYTPGGTAGLQLALLGSLAPPTGADTDARQKRAHTIVSGLLALIGIEADPLRSREHILLTNIIDQTWASGKALDLAKLIGLVQAPPFEKLGVLDLETFFPQKQRVELAMTLNGLLASPSFSRWLEGEPLDISKLLWTDQGKPRVAILSIAHLSDAERMFFVTTLLGELVSWMRTQTGTSSLRALLYMDEVFGYLPPVKEPPSKQPLLTLLKQARAFGVGVVLATQNPVDVDYKALSNAGTWLIGRLQTAQDVERVADGLAGAAVAAGQVFDKQKIVQTLAGLGKRVFLLNSVHETEPVLIHSRWALSFLRGPLTEPQIATLMAERKALAAKAQHVPVATKAVNAAAEQPKDAPPQVADVSTHVVQPEGAAKKIAYAPCVLGKTALHYANARLDLDLWHEGWCAVPWGDGKRSPSWDDLCYLGAATEVGGHEDVSGHFAELPASATRAKSYTSWRKTLKTKLYQRAALPVLKEKRTKLVSQPGESEGAFMGRVTVALREQRDLAIEKVRARYAKRFQTLEDRIRRADDKVEREKSQYSQRRNDAAVTIGASIVGALFGRKVVSGTNARRAATAARSAGRAAREKGDIARAEENLAELRVRLKELEGELTEKLDAIEAKYLPDAQPLSRKVVKPRKADISFDVFGVGWLPHEVSADGALKPCFTRVTPEDAMKVTQ